MASPRSVAVAIIFASPPASPPRDTAAAHDSHAIAPDKGDEEEGPTFLLVSSRKKKNRYVFPKGGIEHGERSPEAAERESWEEAGLRPGTARHLTHLLVLQDPSAHILSPSSDIDSPSFVASCQYSFELFYLPPPPPPSSASAEARIPNNTENLASSTAASAEPATDSEAKAKEDGSPSSHNARIPPSDADPPAIATSSLPTAYESAYLSPTWPESTERDRVLVRGWRALENAVCWGRREQVMREAIRQARHWIEEEQQGEEQELGRIPDAERQSGEVQPA
ncbi:hypothetical protein JCM8115_004916 [Rhodotorula mucilaginosa]|uniref:Nudix hydrolase domain-containing protein n=1 Tax=Rhodotorula mucilaginosa TaxID=5537 RepID=A0A9P7B3R5_RHOMI|nr:hypothetical protein C6P46_006762 [Rhodotorula mucilaginosa]